MNDGYINILGAAINLAIKDVKVLHHRKEEAEHLLAKLEEKVVVNRRKSGFPKRSLNRVNAIKTKLYRYETAYYWLFHPTQLEEQLVNYGLGDINIDTIRQAAVNPEESRFGGVVYRKIGGNP